MHEDLLVFHPCLHPKQTTPTYQRHLTTTSLTLLGQGPWVLQTVGMVLQVRGRIGVHPKPPTVILPVIVTARNQKWLPQLFASHAYKKNYVHRFTHYFHLPCLVVFLATCLHHFHFLQGVPWHHHPPPD